MKYAKLLLIGILTLSFLILTYSTIIFLFPKNDQPIESRIVNSSDGPEMRKAKEMIFKK